MTSYIPPLGKWPRITNSLPEWPDPTRVWVSTVERQVAPRGKLEECLVPKPSPRRLGSCQFSLQSCPRSVIWERIPPWYVIPVIVLRCSRERKGTHDPSMDKYRSGSPIVWRGFRPGRKHRLPNAASETSAPAFEAVDVHISPKSRKPQSMVTGGLRGTRYLVRTGTIVDLIGLAYDVDNDKILGGPSWLDLDRFDVAARAPRVALRSRRD